MRKYEMKDYKIIFEDNATIEFKNEVLKTIVELYNQGRNDLGLVAELSKGICWRNDEEKTAKFVYLGY